MSSSGEDLSMAELDVEVIDGDDTLDEEIGEGKEVSVNWGDFENATESGDGKEMQWEDVSLDEPSLNLDEELPNVGDGEAEVGLSFEPLTDTTEFTENPSD